MIKSSSTTPSWRNRWHKPILRPLLTILLVSSATSAFAQVRPWVYSVAITGDQQFAIYDRLIPGLVANPVYQRADATADPTAAPSGVVQSSTVSLSLDLNGQVPLDEGGILVRLTPSARIGEAAIALTPAQRVVAVAAWSDPDAVPFDLNAPSGVGKHLITIDWTIETSNDGGVTWTPETGDQTQHTLYTTLATPIVSQTAFGVPAIRGNPWIDMLDRSTVWAAGAADGDAAMQALTIEFWMNSIHIYDGGGHSTPSDYNTLNVERFLNPALDIQADCRDMSNFLALLGRSLGLNVTTFRIRGGVTGFSSFWTQYLGPHGGNQPAAVIRSDGGYLGSTQPTRTWTQTRWNYHQIALYNGQLYDACALVELAPFVPRNPSNIINHRNLDSAQAASLGYEYIPPGIYQPNEQNFLHNGTYDDYQPLLVLNESPFVSASHMEQQGDPPIVR